MRSLSLAAEMREARWRELEHLPAWSDPQRDEVAKAVRAVASRLDVSPEMVDACVAHVLDGAPAPRLGPWLPGKCPAAAMGRPRGTGRPLRSRQAQDAESADEEPTPPPPSGSAASARPRLMRSVKAILRTKEAGHLDEDEAAAAIIDMLSGGRGPWNSSMLSPPQAA